MGNTNTSFGGKDTASSARQRSGGGAGTGGHHGLPLRDRFEALAKLVPAVNNTEHDANRPVASISTSSSSASDGTGAGEKFVLFEDCSKLAGPRGAQVAARLYRVLDADGDGRLDFQASRSNTADTAKLTLCMRNARLKTHERRRNAQVRHAGPLTGEKNVKYADFFSIMLK